MARLARVLERSLEELERSVEEAIDEPPEYDPAGTNVTPAAIAALGNRP